MAGTLKIKHNLAAYRAIRSAPRVRGALENIATSIANTCNHGSKTNGYRTSSRQGQGRAPRWRTTVITATHEAIVDNATRNTLIKNMKG